MTTMSNAHQEIAAHAKALLAQIQAAPPVKGSVRLTAAQLAAMIDHTLLRQDATPEQIATLCAEAREHRFASVCVNSCYVAQCARALTGSDVLVGTTVGFPLGAMLSAAKAYEAEQAIIRGAHEVDMVINVGAMKAGDYALVKEDIAGVARICHAHGAHLKVIIEACLLTDWEKVAACLLAVEAGADFVKTSTGFSTGGATVADVALMRAVVGAKVGVKAAGGIRTYEDAMAMINAGASRIGASAGVKIIQGMPQM